MNIYNILSLYQVWLFKCAFDTKEQSHMVHVSSYRVSCVWKDVLPMDCVQQSLDNVIKKYKFLKDNTQRQFVSI